METDCCFAVRRVASSIAPIEDLCSTFDDDILHHQLTMRRETDHLLLVILSVSEESCCPAREILRSRSE
jgi:hypothetical protein